MPPPRRIVPAPTPFTDASTPPTVNSVEIERLAAWLENPAQAGLHRSIRAILRNMLYQADLGQFLVTPELHARLREIVSTLQLDA